MCKNKLLICMLLVLALVIAIPAAILANDSASNTGNVPEYGGNIYNAGNVNISGGTVYGGVARYGGNLFNAKTGNLTVSGAAKILDGVAYVLGGNIYAANGGIFNKNGGLIGSSGSSYDGVYAPTHSSCICGSNSATHAPGCDGDAMAIDWQEWTDFSKLPSESGYYYLTGNVSVTGPTTLVGGQNIYLDLNGKTVYRSGGDRIYNLTSTTSNSLTILDSVGSGSIQLGASNATGAMVAVNNANTFTMYGGTVNGAKAVYTHETAPGAIVRVLGAESVVNIHGGTIIGGTAVNFGGGAVGMSAGTLNMTAGEITGGTAKLGGNIYMAAGSTVSLSGKAAVTEGKATTDGYGDSGSIYVEQGATLSVDVDVRVTGGIHYEYPEEGVVLSVGYGKAEITPTTAVMTGEDKAVKVDDDHIFPVYAITIYMKDNMGHEYLHVVTDLSWAGLKDNPEGTDGIGDQVRKIAAELGFDSKYVTVAGIHTHTGVVYGSKDAATMAWRENELRNGVIASINAAVADAAPADVYTGATETDGLTWVRRYTTNVSDKYPMGYYDGFNQIDSDKPSNLKHESAADEQVQLVKFTRADKKDILMVNWQCHATMADGNAIISSDFVGALRDRLDSQLDVLSVYYQGATGDQAPISRIDGESKITNGSQEAADRLGKLVADAVIAYNKTGAYKKAAVGAIQISQEKHSALSSKNEVTPELLAAANDVMAYFNASTASGQAKIRATNKYALTKGLQSYYHAENIIENASLAVNKNYEINTITIGDVAFVTLPMEVSHKIGMEIKENSKFQTTMLLGYSCGTGKYLMEEAAYENGGYETYNTYFVKGTAEIMRDQYLKQLDEFYASRY